MNFNDINEVWLALEAERAKITTLFEKFDKLERKIDGAKEKDKENNSST
jgi:uncharacterized protein YdcH (DUF465 family)|tara:strand:+ start:481 stop:627 length:147 start_codon:yes stop_codon:yes gene_type:complete